MRALIALLLSQKGLGVVWHQLSSGGDNASACLGHQRDTVTVWTRACFCSCSITDVSGLNTVGNNENFFLV